MIGSNWNVPEYKGMLRSTICYISYDSHCSILQALLLKRILPAYTLALYASLKI